MTGVLIRYPLPIPINVVAEMAEDDEVMTIVASETQQLTAYNQYNNYGVNMNNCTWLIAPSNTCYTRDYGPWYIFDGEGNQGIINHIYNRPSRPDDNRIPRVLGDSLGI
ncbi:MAG: peptidyl-arginine deiminase, partial [FCB group bacterium]|nr:peptidyl-arginine deiminase [FCB group bacterium]